MEKICPKCLNKGLPKYTASNTSYLLWGGFTLGLGFVFLSHQDLSTIFNPLFLITLILQIAIFAVAIYLLVSYYFKVRNLCSKCTNEQMLDVSSQEAQDLDKQYHLNSLKSATQSMNSEKICTNCNYIGQETRNTYFFVIWPILIIIVALSYIFDPYLIKNSEFAILGGAIWILFSLYTIVVFNDRKEDCPNCKKKRTMIPLDTPRAQELIKENNLTVPAESTEQTKAPST